MQIQHENSGIQLRSIRKDDLPDLWQAAYGGDLTWMQHDAPYFDEPVPSLAAYVSEKGLRHVGNPHRLAIIHEDVIIGTVNAYFEDGDLKTWLEVGIGIYDSSLWNRGIGLEALGIYISYLFDLYPTIRRIGFTTWSGNHGMIRLGEKLGMIQEARIRQVRFWQGRYWDSIRYGVLREAWTPVRYKLDNMPE